MDDRRALHLIAGRDVLTVLTPGNSYEDADGDLYTYLGAAVVRHTRTYSYSNARGVKLFIGEHVLIDSEALLKGVRRRDVDARVEMVVDHEMAKVPTRMRVTTDKHRLVRDLGPSLIADLVGQSCTLTIVHFRTIWNDLPGEVRDVLEINPIAPDELANTLVAAKVCNLIAPEPS